MAGVCSCLGAYRRAYDDGTSREYTSMACTASHVARPGTGGSAVHTSHQARANREHDDANDEIRSATLSLALIRIKTNFAVRTVSQTPS